MSNNIKRGRTRAFTLFPAMPAGLKPIQQYKYFDLKPNLLSNKDNDFMANRKVLLNFYKGEKNGVVPYGLKRSNGQKTGTCGDCSDYIRLRKMFGRMQFNNRA